MHDSGISRVDVALVRQVGKIIVHEVYDQAVVVQVPDGIGEVTGQFPAPLDDGHRGIGNTPAITETYPVFIFSVKIVGQKVFLSGFFK